MVEFKIVLTIEKRRIFHKTSHGPSSFLCSSTGQGVAWWLNGVLAGIRGQTPQAAASPHHQRLDARAFRFPNPLQSCHIVSCGIRLCMAMTSYNCAFDWLLSSKIRLIQFFGCTKQHCVSGISGFLGRFGDWVDGRLKMLLYHIHHRHHWILPHHRHSHQWHHQIIKIKC